MQAAQPKDKVTITTSTFAAKFRSKTEVYSFLTVDVGAFLPPRDVVTIYFLKDLVMGNKMCKFPLCMLCTFNLFNSNQ